MTDTGDEKARRREALGAPAGQDPPASESDDGDFATDHDEPTLADDHPGGPEGHREDDSPKGLAGSD